VGLRIGHEARHLVHLAPHGFADTRAEPADRSGDHTLVPGERVDEEALLVLVGRAGWGAPLEGDDIRQTGLDRT
jgi:hypothetical protein